MWIDVSVVYCSTYLKSGLSEKSFHAFESDLSCAQAGDKKGVFVLWKICFCSVVEKITMSCHGSEEAIEHEKWAHEKMCKNERTSYWIIQKTAAASSE